MPKVEIYDALYEEIRTVVANRKPAYQHVKGFVNIAVANQLRSEGVKV